jgi:hypothetical protein
MKSSRAARGIAALATAAAVGISGTAIAGEMRGVVVWVDMKNSALLVVCEDDAGCKDLQGKKGETFTMVIPDSMKPAASAWQEGGKVTVVFEDRDAGGWALKTVSTRP